MKLNAERAIDEEAGGCQLHREHKQDLSAASFFLSDFNFRWQWRRTRLTRDSFPEEMMTNAVATYVCTSTRACC